MAKDEASGHGSSQFADRLNKLFATHRSPDGDEFTLTEVRNATQGLLSIGYLSMLRSGDISRPRLDKVRLLADFFGVSVAYFTESDDVGDIAISEALRRALTDPDVRELALRASELGPQERALYLRLVDYAREVAARIRTEEETTQAETDRSVRDEP